MNAQAIVRLALQALVRTSAFAAHDARIVIASPRHRDRRHRRGRAHVGSAEHRESRSNLIVGTGSAMQFGAKTGSAALRRSRRPTACDRATTRVAAVSPVVTVRTQAVAARATGRRPSRRRADLHVHQVLGLRKARSSRRRRVSSPRSRPRPDVVAQLFPNASTPVGQTLSSRRSLT